MATYGPLDEMDLLNALDEFSGMYRTKVIWEHYLDHQKVAAPELPPASMRAVALQLKAWGYRSVMEHNTLVWAVTRTHTAAVLRAWLHAHPDVQPKPDTSREVEVFSTPRPRPRKVAL